MKKLEQYLIVFAGQVILFGAVVLLTPDSGHGQPPPSPGPPTQNVKVVNTPSEPVPVTGSVNVSNPVTVSGTVNVGNTVLFRPVIPEGAFSIWGPTSIISGPDPAGTSYAITSLTAVNFGSSLATGGIFGVWKSSGTSCSIGGNVGTGPRVFVQAGQTVHLTFPQPFILPAEEGSISCLIPDNPQGTLNFTVVGYRF